MLRCTAKLLGRLPTPSTTPSIEPTTRLGDWYATLILARARQVVLAVSARTLLPVLVPARDAKTFLAPRLRDAVVQLLQTIGIASSQVKTEQRAMEEVLIGKTASRQILGSVNDFVRMYDGYVAGGLSLSDVAIRLADTPCGPLKMDSPRRVTVALFAAAADLQR